MHRLQPRMIEARFVFQAGSPEEPAQFAVAFFLRDGAIRVAFDIHGDGPGAANIDVAVAQAILAAVAMVQGKITDRHELYARLSSLRSTR